MANEVAEAKANPDKSVVPGENTGDWSWLNDNFAVIIGILSVAVVAMRLLSVAREIQKPPTQSFKSEELRMFSWLPWSPR